MHPFVYHNDRVLPLEQDRLSPGQAGLINGWGVFTTVRVYDGQPFALERHYQRLSRDARILQLPLKKSFESVRDAMLEMLRANGVANACVRIYFVHNTVGIWKSDERMPEVDFLMYAVDVPSRVGPTKISVREHGRHAANPLTGTKVISWLNNAWMVEQAHQRGFDDALLLNERAEVAECTAANIFCVRGGQVLTPPLNSGCLAGVTREILLESAPKSGTAIVERTLTLEEVLSADEVFITSTTRQVQAIELVDEHKIRQAPGPATQKLAKFFDGYVKEYLGRVSAAGVK
ncbi:MAG: aminotransferase class IV [Terriglobales bacterium]